MNYRINKKKNPNLFRFKLTVSSEGNRICVIYFVSLEKGEYLGRVAELLLKMPVKSIRDGVG